MSEEFLDCLKRERDIYIKPMLSDVKMAFRYTPALSLVFNITLTAVKIYTETGTTTQ